MSSSNRPKAKKKKEPQYKESKDGRTFTFRYEDLDLIGVKIPVSTRRDYASEAGGKLKPLPEVGVKGRYEKEDQSKLFMFVNLNGHVVPHNVWEEKERIRQQYTKASGTSVAPENFHVFAGTALSNTAATAEFLDLEKDREDLQAYFDSQRAEEGQRKAVKKRSDEEQND